MRKISYAHTIPGCSESEWQVLEDHLKATAQRAEAFASEFRAGEWGYLAGLWHDLGKFSDAFQNYLRANAPTGDSSHRSEIVGTIDHSTAGAQHAHQLGPLGRLLAYCIAGHHAGLPDNVDDSGGRSSLSMRLEKSVESFNGAPVELLNLPLPSFPRLSPSGSQRQVWFSIGFFTRMIYSCLVDADFLDTEAFVDPKRADHRPTGLATCKTLLTRLTTSLDALKLQAAETTVNRHRSSVLDACRAKASLPPGFFSLNVPTGGGKTLSSLAFALEHAVAHDLRRVVYAIPFTSIIEQTADVFRRVLGELQAEVLEHHSNLEPDDPNRQSLRSRLASENFDASLIVTTNVQLFESLFASRSSRCRKLHRLASSVIILDEAQTLPPQLLAPTLAALEELVNNYGTTVVLCTATQPAVERRESFPIGLRHVRPIIDHPESLHVALRRTKLKVLGVTSNDELALGLKRHKQVLCIVNSRRHAADLFGALHDPDSIHLSASMCAAHRSLVVDEIRRRLRSGRSTPCRVISTQVIEAGVDVDFPAVYRAMTGLDSIAQSAGRCNREGLLRDVEGHPQLGRVWVFDYDREAYPTAPLIHHAADKFREILPDYRDDLLSSKAVEAYFRLHYWQQGGDDGRGWDRGLAQQSIMSCFSEYCPEGQPKTLHAQFRTAAQAYRLIDDAQVPILVPFGEQGNALIAELELMSEIPEPQLLRNFDRRAQRYTVGVFERGLKTLLSNDVVWERLGRYYLVNSNAYSNKLGLTFGELGPDLERFVV